MYGGGEDKREVMRNMEIVKITVNSNRGIKRGTMEPIADIYLALPGMLLATIWLTDRGKNIAKEYG
jgi:hypothetical protein